MTGEPPPPPEVVVHADRLPDPAGEAAYSVVRPAPDALVDARGLDEALAQTPGFSLYRRTPSLGANPTVQGASLRAIAGSGASRALVTLDGVPLNDPFGGWVIWSATPAETVDGIKILRGAGSGPYGAGALTGVVALASAAPAGPELEAEGGDLGFRRAFAGVGGALGAGEGSLEASGTRSDGWIPVRQGRGAADRPLSLDAYQGAARVSAPAGPAVATARLSAFEETRGAGYVGSGSRDAGGQAAATLAAQPAPGRPGWRLQAWADASDLANFTATPGPGRNASAPANAQYATPALGWGLNAAAVSQGPRLALETGVDLRGATGESRERFSWNGTAFTMTRKAGGQAYVVGAYGEAALRGGPWLLTAGGRLDGWADVGGERVEALAATGRTTLAERPGDRGGALPTFRAGARRALPLGFALRAAAYAGFRPPTLNELHRPFRVGANVTDANPELKPERLTGVEGGLDLVRGGSQLHATVFANRLADAVTNVTLGAGPGTFPLVGFVAAGGLYQKRENVGAVNATGLEAEAAQALIGDRLGLEAALALTRSRVDGGAAAPQLTGLRPALTPGVAATAGIRWRPVRPLTLRLEARYEGLRWNDDRNTLRLKPGTTADLRVDWALTPKASVFLAVDNLFDAALQTDETATGVYSYDAPRTVRIGLRLRP